MIYTDQHLQLQDSLRRFIDAEINPHVDEWEAAGTFPARELFRKMGRLGFLGVTKPVEYGGAGLDYSYSVAIAEALGHAHCGGVPMAIGVQTDMATPALARFGSDELKREFLAPSIAGDLVACLGVSEVGAGSDVASIRTVARKDGADYLIRGGKMWTTSGTQADWMCLLANTSEGAPHRNKTLICVPMDTPGIEIARKLVKTGMRSSDTAQIFFDEVRVPQRYRIGEEGMGFAYQMMQFQEERLWAAANSLAAGEILTETIAWLREREAFGQPLLANQFVYFKLAELNAEIEAVRALLHRAVELYVGGTDVTQLASMAKLKAARMSREVADWCVQFWGGMGYVEDTRVNRYWRDSRLASIGGGADEVMLGIIAKTMGILPRQ
ncbi:MAG: acyl-CoA dehydrogenase [Lautropia sp.]|nr:MAG: acyl-CoA dehydrogenase [Pseudomonadota bacterium]MBC6959157.1 acyl-CoA dehydrogenase [Lautropia sp.]MCL4701544.1 acyl-CoA dehydrogenase family protein [Burkholderiaceae bacterium]MDL1907363.1 acyl-CoA dehydrogenase [Betaproteobacteria bacterium PRO1]RIK89719.1 MAG: acyl-CoA dehydrogenase [Burkholderiales bacterium]